MKELDNISPICETIGLLEVRVEVVEQIISSNNINMPDSRDGYFLTSPQAASSSCSVRDEAMQLVSRQACDTSLTYDARLHPAGY